jgi:hypothetical protein
MTEGRFETSYNLRPKGFDNRKFWATGENYVEDPPVGLATTRSATGKTHERRQFQCEHDHRQRESCPFHDLRAQGCFQYEMDARGPYNGVTEPTKLTARAAGNPMRTAGKGQPHNSRFGVGGTLLPCDTDIAGGLGPVRGGGPWTRTGRRGPLNNGLFSSFEHMPGDFTNRPKNIFGGVPGIITPFRAGTRSVPALGRPFPHQPDNYPAAPRNPGHWRLRTGKGPDAHQFPHIPEGGPAGGDAAGKERRREIAAKQSNTARGPYVANKPHGGTFSNFRPHLPDPVPNKQIRDYRPPIFTYHAHQKRQNPIIVPFTVGPQTADPAIIEGGCGSVELTQQNGARATVRSLPVMQK